MNAPDSEDYERGMTLWRYWWISLHSDHIWFHF